MGTPALITRNLRRLGLSRLGFPEHIEVHIVLPQVANGGSQLACANTAVKIHHRGSFAGRAWHCPGFGAIRIFQLCTVMKCQGTHIRHLLKPSNDGIGIVHQLIGISLMDRCNAGIQLFQALTAKILQPWIPGIATNQIEVMSVDQILRQNPFGQYQDLIPIIAGDHGVEMNFKSLSKSRSQGSKCSSRKDGLVEVSRNSPHLIVRIPQSVEGNIDVQFEFGIGFKASFSDLEDPCRLQSIRRKVDMADSVIFNEQIDDFFQIPAQSRFAAAEPQIRNLRRAFGKFYNFVPAEIAGLVQFVPVKASVAGGIAMGRDKEDQRVQLSPTPCWTIVCCGEIRL